MQMTFIFSLVVAVLNAPIVASAQENEYRLLNMKERLDYAKAGQLPGPKAVLKDSAGNVIKGVNLRFPVIDGVLYSATDYYVNPAGQIMEVVVRTAKPTDRELNKRLFDIDEDRLRGSIETVKTACPHQREALAEILVKEQENRKNEQVFDVELDNVQEGTVVGLLRQCGEPALATVGTDGLRTIYLVLLHARRKNQEKYFPLLQKFVTEGILKKGAIAAVEDRLLMTSGAPQKYGTQIVFFARTGYHLFPVADPDHLDERRLSAGLAPMEQYLNEREEFYGAGIQR